MKPVHLAIDEPGMAPSMLCCQPPNTVTEAKSNKNYSVGIFQTSNRGYDNKQAEVNLVSRMEDELEKKVFKIILLFKTLFRNIQVHYLV